MSEINLVKRVCAACKKSVEIPVAPGQLLVETYYCCLECERKGPPVSAPKTLAVKIEAVMSVPRLGWQDTFGCAHRALSACGIQLSWYTTAFWHKGIQQGFNGAMKTGADWILSLDYDSCFNERHLEHLLAVFGNNPNMDALAAIQPRRGNGAPLMSVKDEAGKRMTQCTGEKPVKAYSAHFGFTLFRTAALKSFKKPWFIGQPDADGEWSDTCIDPDIHFWVEWAKQGKSLYVDPRCRVGHLELMVSYLDENMEQHHMAVSKWRQQHAPAEAANSLEQNETKG